MIERVCFSGHRVISAETQKKIIPLLDTMLRNLIVNYGAHTFYAGGALGFDTIAAQAVLNLKKEFPKIRLELILPCPDQPQKWRDEEKRIYFEILGKADAHVFVAPYYHKGCMHLRNRRLVESAEMCLAYCRKGALGGTAYTLAYAELNELMIVNLADLLG